MQSHPRQLWLLRHAKAESYQTSDFDRALAEKGIKQVSTIAKQLSSMPTPGLIISSPALRAKQTTEILCEQSAMSVGQVIWNQQIYEASTSRLVSILQQTKRVNTVLLIGHNPGFEGLFEYLTGGLTKAPQGSYNNYTISTATMVQINMPEDWASLAPGCATLNAIITSK